MVNLLKQTLFQVFQNFFKFQFAFFFNYFEGLRQNVSFIQAVDMDNNKIFYSIESNEFHVDKNDGKIFLVAKLSPNFHRPLYEKMIKISCSNGFRTLNFSSKIFIINSNQPPKITNSLFFLELEEVIFKRKSFY